MFMLLFLLEGTSADRKQESEENSAGFPKKDKASSFMITENADYSEEKTDNELSVFDDTNDNEVAELIDRSSKSSSSSYVKVNDD